jgi:hypothetical protein
VTPRRQHFARSGGVPRDICPQGTFIIQHRQFVMDIFLYIVLQILGTGYKSAPQNPPHQTIEMRAYSIENSDLQFCTQYLNLQVLRSGTMVR